VNASAPMVQLISLRTASKRYAVPEATLRLWGRRNDIAAVLGRPFLVDEPSLVAYLSKRANGAGRSLFSCRLDAGCDSERRSTDVL
jgi:hypothetical protein